MDVRGKVAIMGVGHTELGELPGTTPEQLAVRAVTRALEDAGIGLTDVDGLITCKAVHGANADIAIGPLLGINPKYSQTLDYGTCNFSLHLATQAIVTGMADTIVMCYGSTARSIRYPFGSATSPTLASIAGLHHIAGPAALALQRHRYLYGTTEEEFGLIAVSQRRWAQENPLALFKDPLPIEKYLASPYMIEPLRREDVTMISDGGVAVVVTRAENVREHLQKPVYLLGMAQQSAIRGEHTDDYLMRPWLVELADRLWHGTGMRPADVDLLYIQDPTAVWVLQMLESFGFCPIGEGGRWLAEGHSFKGGDVPLNTHGGQLSESYMWGWMHIVEAVRQLRGGCGTRQVDGATTALYCSTQGWVKGAASVLSLESR